MLYPHQHAALVAELRAAALATVDDVHAQLAPNPDAVAARLGTYRFLTQEQYDKIGAKYKPAKYVIIDAETAKAFPSGVPGFPNKLRPEWIDSAWREAQG